MLFQAVLQSLLMRKKAKKPVSTQDLSPMAKSIMQKLAEIDKSKGLEQESSTKPEDPSTKK
jgi:hypothetical protein